MPGVGGEHCAGGGGLVGEGAGSGGEQVQRGAVLFGQEQSEAQDAAGRGLVHDGQGEPRPPILRAQVGRRHDAVGRDRFQAGSLAALVLQLIPPVSLPAGVRGGRRPSTTVRDACSAPGIPRTAYSTSRCWVNGWSAPSARDIASWPN
jgi:hypothetical protein